MRERLIESRPAPAFSPAASAAARRRGCRTRSSRRCWRTRPRRRSASAPPSRRPEAGRPLPAAGIRAAADRGPGAAIRFRRPVDRAGGRTRPPRRAAARARHARRLSRWMRCRFRMRRWAALSRSAAARARFTRASSSPPGATACGSSTSTWRTSAFCSRQVLKQRAAGHVEMQRLLMPLILQLTPEQQIEYARIADELNAHRIRDRAVRQSHHRGESGAGGSRPGRSGEGDVRDSGDRRGRVARGVD